MYMTSQYLSGQSNKDNLETLNKDSLDPLNKESRDIETKRAYVDIYHACILIYE